MALEVGVGANTTPASLFAIADAIAASTMVYQVALAIIGVELEGVVGRKFAVTPPDLLVIALLHLEHGQDANKDNESYHSNRERAHCRALSRKLRFTPSGWKTVFH
ncbi:MAG TPA: hypothetical protein VH437_00705 [Terriglobales bacterium]|jgi:hypothetical protein